MTARPRRRAVVLGAVPALALGGCTRTPAQVGPRPAAPDPDRGLRRAAIAREQALLRAYDDAVAVAPQLAGRLRPLRSEHVTHLRALGGSPTPRGGPSGRVGLRQLRSAERSAAAAGAAAAVAATSALAPVLASLAASEASHDGALT